MRKISIYSYIILLSAGLIFTTGCAVQKTRIKQGDKAYSDYLYNEAIYQYEGIKKKDASVLSKLADSYRLTGNSTKAEMYYAELDKQGNASLTDIMHYAEVLKMNGKYEEAIQKMEIYNQQASGDTRVEEHLADKKYYVPIQQDQGQFKLTSLKMNSVESDFGTSYYKGAIAFSSTRKKRSFTNYEYNWNVKNFLNMYSFEPVAGDAAKVKKIKPIKVKGHLNKKYHEGPATFNADGNLMVFTRNNYDKKKDLNSDHERVLELWYSELDAKGKWGKAQPMPFNNKTYNVGHGALSADGKTLYFVSDMPGGFGGSDIYYTTRNADGSWAAPTNAGDKINTEGKEMFPFYHEKGWLFFASDGHAGLGGLDVFLATAKNQKFGNPKNVGSTLNSNKDDFAFILDSEMKTGYVSSNRDGGKGNDDIYQFELLKPFRLTKKIEGYAKDTKTKEALPGTVIKLTDTRGNAIGEAVADANGYYSFEVEPDLDLKLEGTKEEYKNGNYTLSTKTQEETIQADVYLDRIPKISLLALVTDAKNGAPIENAHLTFKDMNGKVWADVYTDKDGKWAQGLDASVMNTTLNYTITLEKEGYLEKTLTFTHTVNKEGEIKIHELLDLRMGKIELGTDIGKLIDIKPIYFDLGKYKIRPDAAKELDKIVEVMNKYPSIVIELGSHTDCRGSKSSNEKLSDNRAKASAAYVISKGISKDRIYGKGYGENVLVNDCACEGTVKSTCTEDEHQKNRRTEFVIVKINEKGVGVDMTPGK